MTVNGEPRLTCKTPLRDYGDQVEVGPLANFPVIRDLVVELEGFLGLLFLSARRAERGIRLLAILEAGADHPQRPDWPRSRYLKGALLALDR